MLVSSSTVSGKCFLLNYLRGLSFTVCGVLWFIISLNYGIELNVAGTKLGQRNGRGLDGHVCQQREGGV